MRMIYLITFLIVYYNASDYELIVYEYPDEEFAIEVTCAEGVTDCKESSTEESNKTQDTIIYRPYGSYYESFPYIFRY